MLTYTILFPSYELFLFGKLAVSIWVGFIESKLNLHANIRWWRVTHILRERSIERKFFPAPCPVHANLIIIGRVGCNAHLGHW